MYNISYVLIGFAQQAYKLEFARRAGSQVVTSAVCNRSQPDPLGIVLWYGKLEFVEFPVIASQCARLSNESHS